MPTEIRPVRQEEIRTSLRILLARQNQTARGLDTQVDNFLNYVRQQKLDVSLHMVCEVAGRLVASCLGITSGGKTAMLMIPSVRLFTKWELEIVELLRTIVRQAPAHNLRLLQALTNPDEPMDEAAFRQAGFKHLADLLYMERNVVPTSFRKIEGKTLSWVAYDSQTHPLFAETIATTYEGSLDCAALNGLRDIEDIIETHKASGIYTPQSWWVGLMDDQPVGVILLSRVPRRPAAEIVYMGVSPPARGKGIGNTLLVKALQTSRAENCDTLTLAVDQANVPARRLYARHDFRLAGKRRAFIALIKP